MTTDRPTGVSPDHPRSSKGRGPDKIVRLIDALTTGGGRVARADLTAQWRKEFPDAAPLGNHSRVGKWVQSAARTLEDAGVAHRTTAGHIIASDIEALAAYRCAYLAGRAVRDASNG